MARGPQRLTPAQAQVLEEVEQMAAQADQAEQALKDVVVRAVAAGAPRAAVARACGKTRTTVSTWIAQQT